MKRIALLLYLPMVWLSACQLDSEGFEKTSSGLLYKVIESGSGTQTAQKGDVLIMDINYRNSKDSVLFDSKTKADSFSVVLVDPTFQGGVEEGFAMMHEGDIYQFKISADSVFLKTFFHEKLPPYIEPGSKLRFQVKLHRIIPAAVADSMARARDIELRKEEFNRIEAFLKKENMDVMPTENGAYIKTIRPGNGTFPVKGDSVGVYYTGMTLDGIIFDELKGQVPPLMFVLGSGMVIPGWDEAVPFLDEGSVSRVVLPSDLAYGAAGHGKIPGYTSLVFDIEIKKIIHPTP